MPLWLYFNHSSNLLIGVPTAIDEGILIIEVTATELNEDNRQLIATTHFKVHVQPSRDHHLFWAEDHDPTNAAVKYESSSRNLKVESKCEWDQNVFHATLVLDASLNELNAKQRVKLVYKLGNFIFQSVSQVTVSARQSETVARLLGKHVIVAGPGNADVTTVHTGVELAWFLGCGEKFTQQQDFVQVIEHNINTGRISKEIGFNIIGWQVIETQPPKPIKLLRRQKRQATRTPVPMPTVLSATPGISISITSFIGSSIPFESSAEISDTSMVSSTDVLMSSGTPIESLRPSSQLEFDSSTEISSEIPSLETSVISNDLRDSTISYTRKPTIDRSTMVSSSLSLAFESSTIGPIMTSVSSSEVDQTSVMSFSSSAITMEIPSTNTSLDLFLQPSVESTSEISSFIFPTPTISERSSGIETESMGSYNERNMVSTVPNVTTQLPIELSSSPLSESSLTSEYKPVINDTLTDVTSTALAGMLVSTLLATSARTMDVGPSSIVFASSSIASTASAETTVIQYNQSLVTVSEPSILMQPSSAQDYTSTASAHESSYEMSRQIDHISTVLSQPSSFISSYDVSLKSEIVERSSDAVRQSLPSSATSELLLSSTELLPVLPTSSIIVSSQAMVSTIDVSSFVVASTESFSATFSSIDGAVSEVSSFFIIQAASTVDSILLMPSSEAVVPTPLQSSIFVPDTVKSSEQLSTLQALEDISTSTMLENPAMTRTASASDLIYISSSDTYSSVQIFSSHSPQNVTLIGPPRSTSVESSSQAEIFSSLSVPNITLVGPSKTTGLTVNLELLTSSLGSGIYASAGYESFDDTITMTSELIVTETSETATYEITPTPVSTYSKGMTSSGTMPVAPPTTVEISTEGVKSEAFSTGEFLLCQLIR